jgi:hypothetical protein
MPVEHDIDLTAVISFDRDHQFGELKTAKHRMFLVYSETGC